MAEFNVSTSDFISNIKKGSLVLLFYTSVSDFFSFASNWSIFKKLIKSMVSTNAYGAPSGTFTFLFKYCSYGS